MRDGAGEAVSRHPEPTIAIGARKEREVRDREPPAPTGANQMDAYVRRFMDVPGRLHAERLLGRLGLAPWEVKRIRKRAGEQFHEFDWDAMVCGHGGARR